MSYRYVLSPADTANEGVAAGEEEGRVRREEEGGGRGWKGGEWRGREERGGEGGEEVWIEKRGRMEERARKGGNVIYDT